MNWLPKDRNLDNQSPKDRSLNDLEVHASSVLISFYYCSFVFKCDTEYIILNLNILMCDG